MPSPLILLPAYGRKYKTKEEALSDWNEERDFKIENGPYTSIRDIDALKKQFKILAIRYKPGCYINL
jgi:hypothetical protein